MFCLHTFFIVVTAKRDQLLSSRGDEEREQINNEKQTAGLQDRQDRKTISMSVFALALFSAHLR